MHNDNHCDTAVELIQESLHQYIKNFELKQYPRESQEEKQQQHLAEIKEQIDAEIDMDKEALKYHIIETGVTGWYYHGQGPSKKAKRHRKWLNFIPF